MTINLTGPQAPVTDEELDQMIWKLERDGMTPKMLSLMRELREVRRAKGEPVAWDYEWASCITCEGPQDFKRIIEHEAPPEWAIEEGQARNIIPLYTAPSAPVVPDTLPCPVFLEPGLKFGKGVRTQCMLDALNRRAEYHSELDAMTPEQRAEHDAGIAEFKAMLGSSPATHDCQCRTCRPVTMNDARFVVCPECGNKRCPHANDHNNACTGSNELGQDGSAYPAAPKEVGDNIREDMEMGARVTRHRFRP